MKKRINLQDVEEYRKLTEHQKKYIGKNTSFDLDLLPEEQMKTEMEAFIWYKISKSSLVTVAGEKTIYICADSYKRNGRG